MVASKEVVQARNSLKSLSARYSRLWSTTLNFCRYLQTRNFVVQSMPDANPAKWHLAHVTWLFERFVILPHGGSAGARLPTEAEREVATRNTPMKGKFMCHQTTIRSGSRVTAEDHIRANYRSFFYFDARWQFLGSRLAQVVTT